MASCHDINIKPLDSKRFQRLFYQINGCNAWFESRGAHNEALTVVVPNGYNTHAV